MQERTSSSKIIIIAQLIIASLNNIVSSASRESVAPRGYVFVRDTRSLEIDTATNAATNTCSLAEPRLLERPIIEH